MRHIHIATLASFLALGAITLAPNTQAAVSSAELYTGASYKYGRFEARIKFAAGDGVISSFFLWKDGSEVSGTFWNELDFEKVGADCHLETNALFGTPVTSTPKKHPIAADLCADFHTYVYEWTPEYIAWFVDGAEVRRETGATATAFATNASAGMQIRFNVWPGDASFGGNFSPAILPVRQHIDWVQYSSYADGAFTLDWREDFTEDNLSSRWLTGSWSSPKNLSTHAPANVALIDDMAVLSLTSDGSGGSGGSPATSGGSANNAGTTGYQQLPDDGCAVRAPRGDSKPLALLGMALIAGLQAWRRRRR